MTQREVKSTSSGETYVVTQSDSGYVSCTCAGFRFRRQCRHAEVAFPSPVAAPVFLEAALRYAAMGYHVIPAAPNDKRPLVAWKQFQVIAPTVQQIRKWWSRTPRANVAFVLGGGRFAVDLDGAEAEDLLKNAGIVLPANAPRSKTRSGFHVFLSAPEPQDDKIGLLRAATARSDADSVTPGGRSRYAQVDIRGRGIIIAPPSVHPSGAVYEWVVPLTATLPAAPELLLTLMEAAKMSFSLEEAER